MAKPQKLSLRRHIAKRFFVRFHMSLILAAVIASGVGASKLLMELGLGEVRVRYPIAVLASYLVFLLLVRIWIWYVTPGRLRLSPDLDGDFEVPTWDSADAGFSGFGGGGSGGGGASSDWAAETTIAPQSSGGGGGSWLPSIDLDIDLDDGIWILAALAALLAVIFGAAGYLIYAAPQLLPEAALQAALASSLAGVSKRKDATGWMGGVLRSTAIPFIAVFAMTLVLALTIHHRCPQAHKILEAFSCPAAS